MKVLGDYWLDIAIRVPLPGGNVMDVRRFLVQHFTAGASAMSSIEFWKTPAAKGASAHFVIDRDGTIYQVRPLNRTCGHAGVSDWAGFDGLNNCSIGIEYANAGADGPERDAFDWAKKQPGFQSVQARHKNGGPVETWEVYTEAQLSAGEALSQCLVARFNLDDVVGHEDVAYTLRKGVRRYDRKSDPGPAFPMERIRKACGFKGLPKR